ncbi:acyltransferase family protein [Leifsonia sp. 2MCAF36]|uniref:acyltransferase family protein n=1 Tax=Leifsonia sp. 2MCAF36 TaxID=3232988 RepID=UPI003F98E692
MTGSAARHKPKLRYDIQALRALAVMLVVTYHLWPGRVTGGFVGVDVFFVISGYLITSHLVAGAVAPGGIKLGKFWAGRARRLLPLATTVFLATIIGMYALLPEALWRATLRNVVAAALYVQNWALAADSVNYLARDQAPVATQHFWSLSVEEQFYIFWPLMLIAAGGAAYRIQRRRRGTQYSVDARQVKRVALLFVAAVAIVSFCYSLWLTQSQPALAFFSTAARAWEFAAGGLLAFAPAGASLEKISRPLKISASWLGALLIGIASVFFTSTTLFPGVAALVPVAGAALWIWAGEVREGFVPSDVGRLRPIAYIGGISYGIYLWHWPLIVMFPFASGHSLNTLEKIGIAGGAVVLAAASKVLIEDPFRYGPFWHLKIRRSFYPAVAGTVAVCIICAASLTFINQQAAQAAAVAASLPPAVLGAATNPKMPLTPSPSDRLYDRGAMFDCFDLNHSASHSCTYGPSDAKVSIAITGDSHAAHFIPPLMAIAKSNGWRLTTFVGVSCDAGLSGDCGGSPAGFNGLVDGHYNLVLYSAYRGSTSPRSGVEAFLAALQAKKVPMLTIADVPLNSPEAYACIDRSKGDPQLAKSCSTPRQIALNSVPDRVGPISRALGIKNLDLTDAFCSKKTCRAVDGNTIIYQDSPTSHITQTFGLLLRPRLEAAVKSSLASTH